jgi:hypothetical protein
MTFLVFALPRSRTAWTSRYLSFDSYVGHDIATECATPDDFFMKLAPEAALHGEIPLDGTVETAAMLGWRLIRKRLPDARFAVIRRPVHEIERSLSQFGIEAKPGELLERAEMLNEISEHPGVLTLQYGDLCHQQFRQQLFEHCLQRPWVEGWDRAWAWRNVQIDVHARMKYLADNRARIEALKAQLVE